MVHVTKNKTLSLLLLSAAVFATWTLNELGMTMAASTCSAATRRSSAAAPGNASSRAPATPPMSKSSSGAGERRRLLHKNRENLLFPVNFF